MAKTQEGMGNWSFWVDAWSSQWCPLGSEGLGSPMAYGKWNLSFGPALLCAYSFSMLDICMSLLSFALIKH